MFRKLVLPLSAVFAITVILNFDATAQEPDGKKAEEPEAESKSPPPEAGEAVKPRAAAGALDPRSNPVPRLLENLENDDVRVAASAARSLGIIFSPGGKGGDELPQVKDKLIEKLGVRRASLLRREAANALGNIRASSALDALKTAMGDEEIEVALAAGTAVAKILPVDDARAFLVESGSGESETVKTASYEGLSTIAKPADAPFLKIGLASDNWRVQTAAVKGLERAVRAGASMAPEDYDQVAFVLGSPMRPPADAAHLFLSNIRNRECVRAVIKAADLRGDGSEGDVSWRSRTNAIRTIRRMDYPTNQDALPAVVRNLGDPTANVVNEARSLLTDLRERHHRRVSYDTLFPIFLGELEKSEIMSQRSAIMAEMRHRIPNGFASRVAKAAAPILEESMAEPKIWPARAYALDLLGQSGYTGAVEMVAQCVNDNVPNVRQSAGTALDRLAALCSEEEKTKVAAILLPTISNPIDWRKTAIAARAAGGFANTEELLAPLANLLGHDVINVRDGSAHSLSQVARSQDSALRDKTEELVHAELGKTKNTWEHGARVLGALRRDTGIPLLAQILGSTNWRAQENAARAVSEIATALRTKIDSKPLSDALIRAAQSEVLQVQQTANQALRDIAKGA